MSAPTCIEVCSGAGGLALGLERAGFEHLALVENDRHACATLAQKPAWRRVLRPIDLREWRATELRGKVDLFAGGVPCPPFSRAGHGLAADDERDLFPTAMRLIGECEPKLVLLENVAGLLIGHKGYAYEHVLNPLRALGYTSYIEVVNAADYGVPQRRQRTIIQAIRNDRNVAHLYLAGAQSKTDPPTVGRTLRRYVGADGWEGAGDWAAQATEIAPTLVGGSKKHGGPDLGPTQARKAWLRMGVDGRALADEPPQPGHTGPIRLTTRMAAALQGFPASYTFAGGKTAQYRQIANAVPVPLAEALGRVYYERLVPAGR